MFLLVFDTPANQEIVAFRNTQKDNCFCRSDLDTRVPNLFHFSNHRKPFGMFRPVAYMHLYFQTFRRKRFPKRQKKDKQQKKYTPPFFSYPPYNSIEYNFASLRFTKNNLDSSGASNSSVASYDSRIFSSATTRVDFPVFVSTFQKVSAL